MTFLKRLGRAFILAIGYAIALAAGLLEILDDLSKPARRPRR